jgi:NADH-quinone oxidoreductase subunit J
VLIEDITFVYMAVIAVLAALATVLVRSPVRSALSLVVVVFHVAGLFAVMDAMFLTVIQVMVYAGAIIVLFLFTIMLLDLRHEAGEPYLHKNQLWLGIPLAILLLLEAGWIALNTEPLAESMRGAYDAAAIAELGGTGQALAEVLFNEYLLPFEIAGVLLLASSVGALLLARKPDEDDLPDAPDPVDDVTGPGDERTEGGAATWPTR